jgi:predicted ribosomally synthesized peptide with SipW-like signal peptide
VTDTTETKRQRGRKVAAILAGGLVLGVGTMATLASWNDSEFANATFTAGTFKLVGSLNGTTFTDHATSASSAGLTFSTPFSNLQPGSVVYAKFAVQLTSDTTNDGTVTVIGSKTGSVTGLSYQLIRTTAWGCDAATTGTNVVTSSAVGAAAGAVTFDLTKTGADNTAYLCFKVTADSTMTQGQSGTGIWEFSAASKAS